jgi:hypothetical protein
MTLYHNQSQNTMSDADVKDVFQQDEEWTKYKEEVWSGYYDDFPHPQTDNDEKLISSTELITDLSKKGEEAALIG